jgi:hypothetical protein
MIGSHITPRSYLSHFARAQTRSGKTPRLWVYSRGSRPFCSTPHRVGKENGYFAVLKDDGSRDESMEKTLALFDGQGAELLRLAQNETYVMSARAEETLIGYIALMFARTTARRELNARLLGYIRDAYDELATDPAWLQEQAAAYQSFSGILTDSGDISSAAAKVLMKLAKPEHANNGFVQGLLRIAETIFTDLRGKPWQIWEAPERAQFITTDNPVVILSASNWGSFLPGCGFRTSGATTLFPMSPRCCFVTGAGVGLGRRYWRRATVRDVNGVNRALVMCMDRWAYSATLCDDIEWLVNHLGGSVRYGVNAFVPAWMNNASEHIKAKVRKAVERAVPKSGLSVSSVPFSTFAGSEVR